MQARTKAMLVIGGAMALLFLGLRLLASLQVQSLLLQPKRLLKLARLLRKLLLVVLGVLLLPLASQR